MSATSLVDLHTHTTASDGALAPAALVALAAERGLRYLAVTDHDTVAGIEAALAAGERLGVAVIPGVELGTDLPHAEVHVLGYFVDPRDPAFNEQLALMRDSRVGRARAMVKKLAALGIPIRFERVREIAGEGAVGRPHVARALVEAGYVASVAEAFDRYLGRNGPAYAERYKLTPVEAVRTIRRAGGLPGLAHPALPGPDGQLVEGFDVDALLDELVPAGLAAIECYYAGYPPELTERLLGYARRYGLVPTGGSDFHGGGVHEGAELGGVAVPLTSVEHLLALRRPG